MLKVVLSTVLLAALVSTAPVPEPEPDVDTMAALKEMMAILYDKRTLDEDGYSFEVKSADGQYRQEVGMILNKGTKDESKIVMGQYSYQDAFGKQKHYMYIADKNGYRVMQAKKKENMDKLRKSLLG